MSIASETQPVKRRTKGEQTRKQILHAALDVLAAQGIKGTTHRAIAQQANIQLSLTTYYFKDIQQLVHQAFMLSSDKTIAEADAAWHQAFELLNSYSKTTLRKLSTRTELAVILTDMATEYLVNKITQFPVDLAIEQLLFTEIQVSPELRELANTHRNALLAPFIQLCSYFNKTTAPLDADIMLTIFTQLEYRNLMVAKQQIDIEAIHQTVQRIIKWILNVKQ